MAEAAPQLEPEQTPGNADSAPPGRERLRSLEGGGDTSEPDRSWYKPENQPGANDEAENQETQSIASNQPRHENQVGHGYRSNSVYSALKNPRWFAFNKTRAALGGGIIATIVALLIFFIGSGPLQLIHLSQVLQHPFSKHDSDSSARIKRLFRAARNNDVGETRVGRLGSKVFGKAISQLKDLGIEIERNPISGAPTKTTIDTSNDKLRSAIPELEGLNNTNDITIALANRFDIPASSISYDSRTKAFTINSSDYDIKTARVLTNGLANLYDGKIPTSIVAREMTKFFNLPSLFHPIQRAVADKYNKLAGKALQDAEQKDELQREESVTHVAETDVQPFVDDAKASSSGVSGLAAKAVLYLGGACFVYNTSGDIIKINRDLVVLPSALRATDLIAVGSQVQSGQDLSSAQIGQIIKSLNDQNGQSIWQGTALYALAHNGQNVGNLKDLPPDYQQAFSSNGTFATINGWASSAVHAVIPLVPVSITCSGPVQLTLLGLQIAASLVAELGSAGFATPGVVAGWAAEQGINFAVSAIAMHFLSNFVLNKTTAKLAADAFSGPIGGDLLAYGSRAAANLTAMASGGVSLANNAGTILAENDQRDFQSHSIAYKLFNTYDYRSAVSQIIDSSASSPTQDLKSVANLFTNFGSLFTHAFSNLIPHAQAASSYNWDFPQYGLPDSVLNDPSMDDPYANADYVAKNLLDTNATDNNGMTYIDKANKCFGVNISKVASSDGSQVWDVVPDSSQFGGVDPNSESYQNGNCWDSSAQNDENWHRVIAFVFDTTTMKAAACYGGDNSDADIQQACSDLGNNQSSSGTGTPTTSGSCKGGGQYAAIVGPGASPSRIDQGKDFVPSGSGGFDICAPASGTITLADATGHQYLGTSGQAEIIEKLDQAPNAPSSSQYIYYAEIIQINSNIKVGSVVHKGDLIGHSNQSPGIETGWAQGDGSHGFLCNLDPSNPGAPTACGRSFNDWLLAGGGS